MCNGIGDLSIRISVDIYGGSGSNIERLVAGVGILLRNEYCISEV